MEANGFSLGNKIYLGTGQLCLECWSDINDFWEYDPSKAKPSKNEKFKEYFHKHPMHLGFYRIWPIRFLTYLIFFIFVPVVYCSLGQLTICACTFQ
jgi:hypothetical protein